MKKAKTSLADIRFWLVLILIVGAPLHAFLITWLQSLGAPGFIAMWREAVVVGISGLIAVEMAVAQRWPKFDMLDWTIILFAGLALVWLPFQDTPLLQWIVGARFIVMPFLFYVLVRQVPWPKTKLLYRYFLGSAVLVMIFGILHALILPQDFLTLFGYSVSQDFFTPGRALSACQYLEYTEIFCRATSTFGGPTRYGTYVLLVVGMLLPLFANAKTKPAKKTRQFAYAMLCIAVLNIVLTLSRSIWIGATFGALSLCVLSWPQFSDNLKKKIYAGAAAAFVVMLFSATVIQHSAKFSTLRSVFIRDLSTSIHAQYFKEGIERLREHPLGIGVGRVGPATARFGEPVLTENWYLQISGEMGIPGLALFLTMLYLFFEMLYKKRSEPLAHGLFFALVAISVAGLFTHSFEETSTVLLLFAGFGIMQAR